MNPVDATAAVESLAKNPRLTLEPVSAEPPSVEALAERFQALMEGPNKHAEHVDGTEGPNAVSQVLTRGEEMLSQDHEAMLKLSADASKLSPAELLTRTMEVTQQASLSHFRMQAATQLASGTNKSIQTLLKNQ
jgi:type III secretion inner rod protein HrpB2